MNESKKLQPVSIEILVVHQTWQSSDYVENKLAAVTVKNKIRLILCRKANKIINLLNVVEGYLLKVIVSIGSLDEVKYYLDAEHDINDVLNLNQLLVLRHFPVRVIKQERLPFW